MMESKYERNGHELVRLNDDYSTTTLDVYHALQELKKLEAELAALKAAPAWGPGDVAYRLNGNNEVDEYNIIACIVSTSEGKSHNVQDIHRTARAAHLARAEELRKEADAHAAKALELEGEK